ncbi:MAG: hypothetical protein WBB19_01975 [Desulforhopalus sp.]
MGGDYTFAGLLKDHITASVQLQEVDNYATIDRIVVKTEYQTQGIETTLLKGRAQGYQPQGLFIIHWQQKRQE